MLMNRGRVGGQQIVPGSYVADILRNEWDPKLMYDQNSYSPHHTEVPSELRHSCDGLGYRSWFWTWPTGQFCAIGAFGQQFNVHPEGRVVVAKFSAVFPEDVKTWHRKSALERVGMKAITEQIARLS
jgi:CubicO group peptidase (beta-lactamase class C family)